MSVTWIEASAGTGKTYTLVKTVVDLVVGGLGVEKILLVTFTEKATAELKTRIRRGLRDAWKATDDPRLAQALEDLPSLTITTIHGFCRALLTQFPLESGVSFEPELVDQGRRWRQLLREELRPRLADLDPRLLAWADLEDEEALLSLAQEALDRNLFALPLAHPTPSEQRTFEAIRADLEARRGPLWDAVDALAALDLPEDSRALGSVELLHATNHRKPYHEARTLGAARDFRDLARFLTPASVALLARWDQGTSLWKKAAQPPFEGRLEGLWTAAVDFVQQVAHLESGLPGVGLGAFLTRAARYRLLADLCLPVLERRSDKELTFHDLIDRVGRLVSTEGSALAAGASARWKAVLVDEFQDTDPEQWAIFSRLFLNPDHDLVLVGDPKQSIYRFRGADLDMYRRVRLEVGPVAEKRVLEDNYRSTAAMVEAINALFDPSLAPWDHPEDFSPSRKGDKAIETLVRGTEVPPLAIHRAATERDWHRHLVATTLDLLARGSLVGQGTTRPLNPGDFLVLVRKKREAWNLYRLFTSKGLPATVGGSGGLLKGPEAREVLLFLKALESPRSLSAARALGWTRLFAGATVEQLAPALDEARDDRDRGAYLRAFRRVAAALEPQVVDGGGLEALLAQPGGPRLVTNTEHVLELVQERAHRGEVAPGQAALALETWIASGLQEDEVDLRRAGESPTIKLLTIHAAKGLEAPVVLHGWPGDTKARRRPDPDWLVGDGVDFLVTEPGLEDEARREAAEELRLRYVALTRARTHQVFIDPQHPLAVDVAPLGTAAWAALAPWVPPDAGQLVPELGPAIDGLESRHPWVESHSGLWRRATRDEANDATVWDRPRVRRDEEATESWLADELPAGPVFGDLVHDLLEVADWRGWAPGAPDDQRLALERQVADLAQRQRASFGGRDLSRPLGRWLGRVLDHPLALGEGTLPVRFTGLAPSDTRRELEFHLPLGLATTQTFDWGGRTFAVHPGYLTGRIDLVFRWEGRLYLADWKTNRLAPGQTPRDVMAEAGYDLQAQWYWEALRRLCRLQGEPLEPGGILYVFLRGPGDQPLGVFLDPQALDARPTLDRLFLEVTHG